MVDLFTLPKIPIKYQKRFNNTANDIHLPDYISKIREVALEYNRDKLLTSN